MSLVGTLKDVGLTEGQINLIILSFIGFGYLMTEVLIVPIAASRTKRLINRYNNLKRDYYKLYIRRCKDELPSLLHTMMYEYQNAYSSHYELPLIDGKVWPIDYVLPLEEMEIEHGKFVPKY